MATVTLDKLCKRYERSHDLAVDHVSLAVAHGEFMVLLGPSGCGKSTTLRMIAGLEAISSGELAIDGRVVNEVPAKDRDIAMVFQSYALYPHMTVRDNLALRPAPARHRRRRDRAPGAGRRRHAGPRGAARAQALRAFRRAAPAGGARPRDRPRSEGVPVRRAALQPRRVAARLDPRRADQAAPPPRRDHDLRHPRPGRGDDHGQPDLHHGQGQGRADRRAARGLSPARRTCSSPASSATRR